MGLTNKSVSKNAVDGPLIIKKQNPDDLVIALAGNPNVGKSTVFNALTGLRQHTGNWPGKTVSTAQGTLHTNRRGYVLVDIPGTYSLMVHSAEEEVARNFICFGQSDAVIVVCDATCLERNLNLVLQTLEITNNVIVCVNLLDEAERKHIKLDLNSLENALGVPVIGVCAQKKSSLNELTAALDRFDASNVEGSIKIEYDSKIEKAIDTLIPILDRKTGGSVNLRWLSLRLLDRDMPLIRELKEYIGIDLLADKEIMEALSVQWQELKELNLKDSIATAIMKKAQGIAKKAVNTEKSHSELDRRLDKILTGKWVGYPVMLLLLILVFWLTISAANYPSRLLSNALFWLEDRISEAFLYIGIPQMVHDALVLGVYRTLAWIVSVMLPPMAIFFPLFTLLEDLGYLPRVAFNLDKPFRKCGACGKQALTMCMGFGCNAAGVVGARIIDSKRERLLAIITNSFVPCNGRFPSLISIITMFFIGGFVGAFSTFSSAALLTAIILLGVGSTFLVTYILSKTLLKGQPSSFTLELPSYRKPQIAKTLVRSVFDRTLFVLGRAVAVAAPAGLILWIMANISIGEVSLLCYCAELLDPFASLMGLDGIILIAFMLGFPANEIVVPIIIMGYLSQGSLTELPSLFEMKEIFVSNGWTQLTALNVMLFSLFHWPCSTTLITIRKETGSLKWTALSFVLPTLVGIAVCMLTNLIFSLL